LNTYILNGPPGSGKDTLGALLASAIQENQGLKAETFAFKDSLYRMTYNWLVGDTHFVPTSGIHSLMKATDCTYEDFVKSCEDRELKETKVFPVGITFNVEGNAKDFGHKVWSPRMCLQFVSEKLAKPRHGNDVFGVEAAVTLSRSKHERGVQTAIFTDGGFVDEINCVAMHSAIRNVTVINLHREGCNFDGDSRDYVTESTHDIKFVEFHNNKDIPESLADLCDLLGITKV
jgi:hypothetical protein